MKYLYYPGCSLEGTAKEYDISVRAVLESLGAELVELKDWSCCGASAAEAVSSLLSLSLPAVNLAIAETMDGSKDLLVPCSACYLNLKKVEEKTMADPDLRNLLNQILEEKSIRLKGMIRVRHLLDVMARDIGPEPIRQGLKRSLHGLSVAPYYGCQCLRPYAVFDDPEVPRSMAPLIEATGAAVYPWHMGGKCCGASNMNTKTEVAVQLVAEILKAGRNADVIVTVCPMCQMNLEGYQRRASKAGGRDLSKPVLYLPQLIGLAMGMPADLLGLGMNLSPAGEFLLRLNSNPARAVA